MPARRIFDVFGEEELRAGLRFAMENQPSRCAYTNYELAIDYLNNRMLDDCVSELRSRAEYAQATSRGRKIQPCVIGLTERYAAEAASGYSGKYSVDLQDEEATRQYLEMRRKAGVHITMRQAEQIAVLLNAAPIWWQSKGGMAKPRVLTPHRIRPVLAPDDDVLRAADPADPNDYWGFIVPLNHTKGGEMDRCVFVTPAAHYYYQCTAGNPFEFSTPPAVVANPIKWPQKLDDGSEELLPLQMVTFLHARPPVDDLLPETDCPIVIANREFNVQWSMLWNLIWYQAGGQLIVNTMDGIAPSTQSYGPMFAVVLKNGETANYITAPNNYTGIVEVLKAWTQVQAVAHRQSPNDFATDGAAMQSGFAKIIDSLPKIDAHEERTDLYARAEEHAFFPRIAAIGMFNKQLTGDVTKLQPVASFEPPEIPESPTERNMRQDHDFKHGLDSPVKVLMREHGISKEEAEEMIAENRAAVQAGQPPQPQNPFGQPGGSGGNLPGIGRSGFFGGGIRRTVRGGDDSNQESNKDERERGQRR